LAIADSSSGGVRVRLSSPDPKRPSLSTAELVAMVGGLMMLNAFSIDIMLPALPDIAHDFDQPGNARQLVITAYVFGFGIAQLVFGPVADAIGRRRTLMLSLAGYAAATGLCIAAPGFEWLLAARALQGAVVAASRVVAMAVIRDLVSGRRMAEIMSFAMTVFMAAPIFAPTIGQGILFVGGWQYIFAFLLVASGGLFAWMQIRLPETLPEDARIPFNVRAATRNYVLAAKSRITVGYMAAGGLIFGSLFAFLASSEQVIGGLYGLEAWFGPLFAGVAIGLALANIVNARLVGRLGMRRLSHTALVLFIAINSVHALLSFSGPLPFWAYYALTCAAMMLFAMIGANFSALVMEPAGERAGTTAALYGATTSLVGSVLGSAIGQTYDGSVTPLVAGMALLGAIALMIVVITERGRLYALPGVHEEEPAE
jgi:DHA1 family bicyclomycin/chloramphenicol resistance-like MFS transporter